MNPLKVLAPTPTSTAETAYLRGPGCLRLSGKIPLWRGVNGQSIKLHPKYIRRIIVLGLADVSGATFSLLWRSGISVTFLDPSAGHVLSHIDSSGLPSALSRMQCYAAGDRAFRLRMSRDVVQRKSQSTTDAVRYYQRQGKGQHAAKTLKTIRQATQGLRKASEVNQVLGIEGAVARAWWQFFATVLPECWKFTGRQSRPSPDPVNAMLSYGYTMLYARARALLTAHQLDTQLGFLHAVRPGRASLACDLVEPMRIPFVDRLVVSMLARKQINPDDFALRRKRPCEIRAKTRTLFLASLEKQFGCPTQASKPSTAGKSNRRASRHSLNASMKQCIEFWTKGIRQHHNQSN